MNKQLSQESDLNVIRTTLAAAKAAMGDVHGYRPACGCGRVYVDLGKVKMNTKAGKLIASMVRLTSRPYSSHKVVYIGYDNATGLQWAQGEAFANALNAAGFYAYNDGDND